MKTPSRSPAASAPFAISEEVAKALDPIATRDIAKQLILHRRPLEAWRIMESTGQLGDLWQVFDAIRSGLKYDGIDEAQHAELTAPLAPSIMKSLSGELTSPSDDGVSHCSQWLSQPPGFVDALAKADSRGELVRIFIETSFEGSLGRGVSHDWKDFSPALRAIPGLWEAAIEACVKNSSSRNKSAEGRVGSPGLLLAAADFGPRDFERCLSALAGQGLDLAECVAQRWADQNQGHLSKHLRENNALTDALAGGQAEVVERILEINPKLDVAAEARRVGEICEELSEEAEPGMRSAMASMAANAASIAEAIHLRRSIQGRTAKAATKPAPNL